MSGPQSEWGIDLPEMPLPPEMPVDEDERRVELMAFDRGGLYIAMSTMPPSPANGEYREPMDEARKHGLDARQRQRLENATYTAVEVKALTTTATLLGKKLGRVEAAEDLIVALEEAALNMYGTRHGLHEAVDVVRYYLQDCKEGDS